MIAEPYTCELDPDTKTTLKIYLFKNVQNTETIRKKIVEGVWKCAAIKPSLILDPFQIVIAANKSVVSEHLKCMVTRTVYAEILYNLSLTKNISQSLTNFGIENGDSLLICFLITAESDESKDIVPLIEGQLCPISDLNQFTDLKEMKSVYKLNKVALNSDNDLLDIVVSRMVTKNFVSH